MNRAIAAIAILAGAALGSAVWLPAAQGEEAKTSSRAATTKKAVKKSAPSDASLSDEAKILRKLDQILENQETLLASQQQIDSRFDAVMEELRIVKVRASLNRAVAQ
jgi:hypothetical protein